MVRGRVLDPLKLAEAVNGASDGACAAQRVTVLATALALMVREPHRAAVLRDLDERVEERLHAAGVLLGVRPEAIPEAERVDDGEHRADLANLRCGVGDEGAPRRLGPRGFARGEVNVGVAGEGAAERGVSLLAGEHDWTAVQSAAK